MLSGAVTDEKGTTISLNRSGTLEETYWDFSYSPLFLADGSVGDVFNISSDVTKQVVAERELRRSERRSDRILSSIGNAVIVTDATANVTRLDTHG